MLPTRELLVHLKGDYPDITFVEAADFAWSASSKTLRYDPNSDNALYMLHEIAHATLEHRDYELDVSLLAQEREAWDEVRYRSAARYSVTVDDELIEAALDTYRVWLYERSRCPSCALTGLQIKTTNTYRCINCRCLWQPNEARSCALRRYKLTT